MLSVKNKNAGFCLHFESKICKTSCDIGHNQEMRGFVYISRNSSQKFAKCHNEKEFIYVKNLSNETIKINV